MDRSISVATFRTLGIADDQIDIMAPEQLDDDNDVLGTHDEVVSSYRKRQQWLNHVRLRQLESEIYSINFGNAQVDYPSYSDWMTDIDRRLHSWKEAVIALSDSGPDWFDFVMSTVRFYLHMPCPRNPSPTDSSKLICFDAATTTLYGYLGMMQTGFLKFDWHCAHQCHSSAMLVLDNIPLFNQAYSNGRVMALLNQFSEAFVSQSYCVPFTSSQAMYALLTGC